MSTKSYRRTAIAVLVLVTLTSCFGIIDKGRRRIAVMNGKAITRDDFDKVLREMSPKKRPLIRTKGDMYSAVQNYLDKCVRDKNAETLLASKKIFVPRELAEAVLRMREPEVFFEIKNPEEYEMKQEDMKYMAQEREYRIDEMLKELEAEQGVQVRIDDAIKESSIPISDKEYADEFAVMKDKLNHPEHVVFTGLLVPGATQETRQVAAEVARKMQSGTSPEEIAKSMPEGQAIIIKAELAHDSANPKFAPFWQQAAGTKVGDVFGPIFIQGWMETTQDAQGKESQNPYPAGLMVAVTTGRTDETPNTLEESQPELQRSILYAKVMDKLRQENGVQIFEDQLADPGMYGNQ